MANKTMRKSALNKRPIILVAANDRNPPGVSITYVRFGLRADLLRLDRCHPDQEDRLLIGTEGRFAQIATFAKFRCNRSQAQASNGPLRTFLDVAANGSSEP